MVSTPVRQHRLGELLGLAQRPLGHLALGDVLDDHHHLVAGERQDASVGRARLAAHVQVELEVLLDALVEHAPARHPHLLDHTRREELVDAPSAQQRHCGLGAGARRDVQLDHLLLGVDHQPGVGQRVEQRPGPLEGRIRELAAGAPAPGVAPERRPHREAREHKRQ
jgi:hypothetical protein